MRACVRACVRACASVYAWFIIRRYLFDKNTNIVEVTNVAYYKLLRRDGQTQRTHDLEHDVSYLPRYISRTHTRKTLSLVISQGWPSHLPAAVDWRVVLVAVPYDRLAVPRQVVAVRISAVPPFHQVATAK